VIRGPVKSAKLAIGDAYISIIEYQIIYESNGISI
jgi:hypothetical protein